jgi:hypothetical protein
LIREREKLFRVSRFARREELRMEKMRGVIFTAILILGLVGGTVWADESMPPSWGRTYSSNQLLGMRVETPQGEELGRIQDLVVDSRGHVPFVVVFYGGTWGVGGKAVAVPFGALTLNLNSRMGRHFTLNTTKKEFMAAPDYRMGDLANEKWAAEVYRYFGQQPYWTEGGSYVGEPRGKSTP